jgi:hypothetical protein
MITSASSIAILLAFTISPKRHHQIHEHIPVSLQKTLSVPLAFTIVSIAGHPRYWIYNSFLCISLKGSIPYIRSSYYRNNVIHVNHNLKGSFFRNLIFFRCGKVVFKSVIINFFFRILATLANLTTSSSKQNSQRHHSFVFIRSSNILVISPGWYPCTNSLQSTQPNRLSPLPVLIWIN